MDFQKRLKLTMIMLAGTLMLTHALVPYASPQEVVMTLSHGESGVLERPPVSFPHERHAGRFDCLKCHHAYDVNFNNRGGEDSAQSCANCHGPSAAKRKPALAEAFHQQCKQCHQESGERGGLTGPVMCGGCHVRK